MIIDENKFHYRCTIVADSDVPHPDQELLFPIEVRDGKIVHTP
jgi:hypothetical protein